MKWPWTKSKKTPLCEHHFCACGGIKSRQTTLEEFGFEFLHPNQTKLTDFGFDFDPIPIRKTDTTERIGMKSKKRKYRGNI